MKKNLPKTLTSFVKENKEEIHRINKNYKRNILGSNLLIIKNA